MKRYRPKANRFDALVLATCAFGSLLFLWLTATSHATPLSMRAVGAAYAVIYGLGALGMATNRRWRSP